MDNFRRYRRPAGRPLATDGFVNSPHARAKHAPMDLRPQAGPGQAPRRTVGDFRATDGFHTQRPTPNATSPSQSLRPSSRDTSGKIQPRQAPSGPTMLDKKKPRRFSRFNPFRPSNWSKRKVALALVLMVVAAGGGFGAKAWFRVRHIFAGGGSAVALQEHVDPASLRGEGDGRVNILLLGRGGAGQDGPDLTDTIIVVSINLLQKEAALLSVPRDLWVANNSGSHSKINAVFAFAKENALESSKNPQDPGEIQRAEDAGFKAVEDVIQSKIGLPIHYHGIIDFDGFRKAIDTVGGVDINVPATGAVSEKMRLYGQPYLLGVDQGQQHFDGLRALAYSRSRHTSTRGDFDRSERQRMILVALKNKILTLGTYSNPIKVSKLMDDFSSHIRTNMSLDEVMRLYSIGKTLNSNSIASVGLADPPNNYVTTGNISGQSVVMPRAGVDDFSEIQNFVRNRLRDGFLAQEDAKIVVLNGTTIPGLAARSSKNLQSYGYDITNVADAPTKGYHTTMVVDLTGGAKKYTKRYLENRFAIGARDRLPDPEIKVPGADFVIILGQNEQARLSNP